MKFGIISCCYNVEEFIQKHIDSVWSQKGCEFIHYIVDDGSSDKTAGVLRKEGERLGANFMVLTKPNNSGALHSWIQAMENIPLEDEEVVIELDGDDYFLHDRVLLRIKEEYDKGYLATYGNYKCEGVNTDDRVPLASICKPKDKKRHIRQQLGDWRYSAPRTFKKKFFKEIPVWNFLDHAGNLFRQGKDIAYFLPIIELVGMEHLSFIEEELMAYSLHPQNDHNILKNYKKQEEVARIILRKTPLKRSGQSF